MFYSSLNIQYFIVFMFGSCIGSFLNVCIYRIPNESMSIFFPIKSKCMSCKNDIRFYDNIPILSYFILRGKCRDCGTYISYRYPFIELITGLSGVAAFITYGSGIEFVIYFTLIASLIVITFIDIDHFIIPDIISLPGIIFGFISSFFLYDINWTESLSGILVGGGILFIIGEIYFRIKKIEGMGGGDVKLLAMLGAFFGIKGIIFIIFISSAMGTLAGIFSFIFSEQKIFSLKIPFGPFLSLAAIIYLFWGNKIIYWYLTILY